VAGAKKEDMSMAAMMVNILLKMHYFTGHLYLSRVGLGGWKMHTIYYLRK
jgi:hypothetical protein